MPKTMKEMVKEILSECPETRGCDQKLYAEFVRRNAPWCCDNLFAKMAEGAAPSYEGVTRCRRKIQESGYSLRPEKNIFDARQESAKNKGWTKWL